MKGPVRTPEHLPPEGPPCSSCLHHIRAEAPEPAPRPLTPRGCGGARAGATIQHQVRACPLHHRQSEGTGSTAPTALAPKTGSCCVCRVPGGMCVCVCGGGASLLPWAGLLRGQRLALSLPRCGTSHVVCVSKCLLFSPGCWLLMFIFNLRVIRMDQSPFSCRRS